MPNTPISRETVHSLAEACSDQGELFQPVAARLIKHQRRLSRFFEQNVAEDSFHERAKAVEWRAQPHLLDEILWALYERDDKSEGEVDLEPEKAALVYLMLWAAIEALDANWVGPSAS